MTARARLDILFVGALPPLPGGAPISTARLLVELARRGHAVRAVGPLTPRESRGGDPFAERHPEIRVHRFPVPFFEIATGRPPTAAYRRREGAALARAAAPLLRERLPDLLLAGRESFAWHVPPLARACGRPCVVLARGNPTRLVLDGAYPAAEAESFLDRLRSVDLVVAVAEHLAAGLRRRGIERVLAIPNAVDLDAFTSRPRSRALCDALDVAPHAPVVAHLSNMSPIKRPLDLVDAVARVLPRLPDLVTILVGDGPLRRTLEEAAVRLGIRHALRFTGWVDHGRIADYINAADLVVMPSAAEGLARVYLETQACERVLVASDIPAAREVVTDGVTGLLFRTGDADDLARQIVRAATDADLRAAIGRNARAGVAGRHGIADTVAAYEAALTAVAAACAPPAPAAARPIAPARGGSALSAVLEESGPLRPARRPAPGLRPIGRP